MTSIASVDLERAWALAPQVALRPEPFGALAYHFGTRRLTFLKSRKLLEVVQSLERHASAHDALRTAGIDGDELIPYQRALRTLAEAGMIAPRREA